MMSLSRRKLLQLAAFGVASQMLPFRSLSAFAQTTGDYRALVCVFLFGGNDGDNTVYPIDSPSDQAYLDYANVRNAIALPKSTLPIIGSTDHATYGVTTYGLHPSMTALHGVRDKLAVLGNVGTLVTPMTQDEYRNRSKQRPQSLFSHSDQQRQMQNASPSFPSSTGWGGRIIDQVQGLNPPLTFPAGLSMSGSNTLLLGALSQPVAIGGGSSILLRDLNDTNRTDALEDILKADTGFPLMQAANSTLGEGMSIGQSLNDALVSGTVSTTFPNSSLGRQLENVAKIIQARNSLRMRRQIFFCATGGFDTHSDQLPRHVGILGGVSDAMAAFYKETEAMGVENEVTAFTASDFGRTFQPNPNNGTDHAWGSVQFVLGGAVTPGLYGTFPTLQLDGPDTTDSRGRWIPTTALDQYGATLATWFGINPADLNTVFPNLGNFPTQNLGFV